MHNEKRFILTGLAKLKITASEVTFPPNILDLLNERDQFVQAMFKFYTLIINNFDNIMVAMEAHVQEVYGCHDLYVEVEHGALELTFSYPREKVVILQCDQSSGYLATQLAKCLVTHEVLNKLQVTDLKLTTELLRLSDTATP